MHQYPFARDLIRDRSPERPVALVRPHAVAAAVQWFHDNLKAQVFYAVKANPSRWVVEALVANGVKAFDVASLAEIELVRSVYPDARLAFMHPVKSRGAIKTAYADLGVRTFVLDSHDELQKIIDTTGGAEDLTLIVRMSVSAPGAAYALTGKFGVAPDQAPALLQAARQAVKDGQMGVSFHVGSQCMRPSAYEAAMTQAARAIKKAGVFVDIVDVGGGFPSVYPGMVPPDLSEYADAVHRGFREMPVGETSELWCEPGRALVAESTSVLCRVELRKDDALYLNDGSYGSLFDATHFKWPLPVRLVRLEQEANDERLPSLQPFRFYGPTCDSIDHMPGPFWLPADIQEGDFIEIGMMGAYGVAMATGFNGHGAHEIAMVEDRCTAWLRVPFRPYAPRPKRPLARSFVCHAPGTRRVNASGNVEVLARTAPLGRTVLEDGVGLRSMSAGEYAGRGEK